MKAIDELLHFMDQSPTAFHAVASAAAILEEASFVHLEEGQAWDLMSGGKYYVTRNSSAIIAFTMPQEVPSHFLISASHTDSPMLKLKEHHLVPSGNAYQRISCELYGGTIYSSWLDRPLSLAGRVVLCRNGQYSTQLVSFDRDLFIIPNVAIHFNRQINTGYAYNPAVDLVPLFSTDANADLEALVAKELGVEKQDICRMELYVCNRMPARRFGADGELFASARIDNLVSVWGCLSGLTHAKNTHAINIFYAADNEETGSVSRQGAQSLFLSDTVDRICEATGADRRILLASSMMVSCDGAQAKHPNHPELSDTQNAPILGGGVVIKHNAAQKYTTNAISAAVFEGICRHADVPVQEFANRSDLAGGSTLGSISNTNVPLLSVDIGVSQLAMHSACETAGVADAEYLSRAMKAFYEVSLESRGDGNISVGYGTN